MSFFFDVMSNHSIDVMLRQSIDIILRHSIDIMITRLTFFFFVAVVANSTWK